MDFDQWQQHWASRSKPATNDPVGWKRPLSVDRPFHAQTPADYALDTALGDNPAVATGANEVDLGLIADQLSPLPTGDPVAGGQSKVRRQNVPATDRKASRACALRRIRGDTHRLDSLRRPILLFAVSG